jgi:hypothetical protein
MTNVPSMTCPVTRLVPPHAMAFRGCHGMGAWSRQSCVERWWAPLCGWGRETRQVLGDRPLAVLAWWGLGAGAPPPPARAGRAGRAVRERNPKGKKYYTRWDTSRLIGIDSASNRSRNNYVCKLWSPEDVHTAGNFKTLSSSAKLKPTHMEQIPYLQGSFVFK